MDCLSAFLEIKQTDRNVYECNKMERELTMSTAVIFITFC